MPPHGLILILEDSAARNASFQAAIELGGMVSCIAADSATFLQLARDSKRPGLVSLDHDLKPTDVLDGLAVLREILQLWADAPVPVVVHTSNVERGAQMMGELELADWPHERVLPFGDDWVARDWLPCVTRLLGRQRR